MNNLSFFRHAEFIVFLMGRCEFDRPVGYALVWQRYGTPLRTLPSMILGHRFNFRSMTGAHR